MFITLTEITQEHSLKTIKIIKTKINLNVRYIISFIPEVVKYAPETKSVVVVRGAMTTTYRVVESCETIMEYINQALKTE